MRALGVLAAAVLVLACQATTSSAEPVASLSVLTGTVQLTSSGAATATVAQGGDQLRAGDRVETGPGTRAVVQFEDGDQVRLDSGSITVVASRGMTLLAGQAWARNRSGSALSLSLGAETFRSTQKGDEFAAAWVGGRAVVLAYAGSVTRGRAAAGVELSTPWAVLNRVLDQDASPRGPAALGTGELLPGEETSAQQAVAVPPGAASDLDFTAGWQSGRLELLVLDPDGRLFDHASGDPPITVRVPAAKPGGWEFRLHRLDQGAADPGRPSTWFVAISLQSH